MDINKLYKEKEEILDSIMFLSAKFEQALFVLNNLRFWEIKRFFSIRKTLKNIEMKLAIKKELLQDNIQKQRILKSLNK